MNRTMKLGVAGCPHNPGDIIHIDDEAWLVYGTDFTGTASTVVLMPLRDWIASSHYIKEAPEGVTISEYLDSLCTEYESDCCS